jgi:hypothetical protein
MRQAAAAGGEEMTNEPCARILSSRMTSPFLVTGYPSERVKQYGCLPPTLLARTDEVIE